MIIRSGIAADEKNIDELRTEINGWFAEVSVSLLGVPRVTQITTVPLATADANVSILMYNFDRAPQFIIGARYSSAGAGVNFNTLWTIYQSTITNRSCSIRHLDKASDEPLGSIYFACHNLAAGNPAALIGPLGEEIPSGGAPIRT